MAQIANTYATFNSTINREQLMNKIWNVSVSETPTIKLIGKGKAQGVFDEWSTDAYRAAKANKVEQGNQSSRAARVPPLRYGNRTQIVEDVFGVTGTQEEVEKAGGKSEYNRQLAKTMVELKKDIEFAILQNTTAVAASAGVAPQARGIFGFMSDNVSFGVGGAAANPLTNTAAVDGTARAFSEALMKTVLQSLFDNGADMETMYGLFPSSQRTAFDAILAGTTRFDKAEDKTLTATLEIYIGPFGRVKTVNARHMRQREIAFINPEFLELAILRQMKDTPLGVTGDTKDVLVNCEFTLRDYNPKAHGAVLDLQ
jgi:hypothetical protein